MPYTSTIRTNRCSTRAFSITIRMFAIRGERILCHVVGDGAATEFARYVLWSSTHFTELPHTWLLCPPPSPPPEKEVTIKASVENLSQIGSVAPYRRSWNRSRAYFGLCSYFLSSVDPFEHVKPSKQNTCDKNPSRIPHLSKMT